MTETAANEGQIGQVLIAVLVVKVITDAKEQLRGERKYSCHRRTSAGAPISALEWALNLLIMVMVLILQ
jgi:hypothetical protein